MLEGRLPLNFNIPSDKYSQFHSMAISGNDVYIVENIFDSFYYNSPSKAYYWKNDSMVDVSNYGFHVYITSIAVSGSDVYLGGYYFTPADSGYNIVAGCWKNGTLIPMKFPPVSLGEEVNALAVSGNDLYIAGAYYLDAVYWKNGGDRKTCKLNDTLRGANVYGIAVSGDDVYIVGDAYTMDQDGEPDEYYAAYWKNGEIYLLSNLPSHANSIAIQGGNVYVGGWIDNFESVYSTCWKNGVEISIANSVINTIPSYQTGLRVFASGNDLYYAESIKQLLDTYAAFWKNGDQPLFVNPSLPTHSFIVTGIGVVQ